MYKAIALETVFGSGLLAQTWIIISLLWDGAWISLVSIWEVLTAQL